MKAISADDYIIKGCPACGDKKNEMLVASNNSIKIKCINCRNSFHIVLGNNKVSEIGESVTDSDDVRINPDFIKVYAESLYDIFREKGKNSIEEDGYSYPLVEENESIKQETTIKKVVKSNLHKK